MHVRQNNLIHFHYHENAVQVHLPGAVRSESGGADASRNSNEAMSRFKTIFTPRLIPVHYP